jgi:hypothetical protein
LQQNHRMHTRFQVAVAQRGIRRVSGKGASKKYSRRASAVILDRVFPVLSASRSITPRKPAGNVTVRASAFVPSGAAGRPTGRLVSGAFVIRE